MITIVVVQLLSHDQLFAALWTAACQAPPIFTIYQSLLKFTSIGSVVLCNQLMLCHPLFIWLSIFLSIRVYSNESALHIRWPKHQSFSISPSNEYSGLISFRTDWLDLLAIQGTWTLKSLLQHHNSKASILWHSAFFMIELSYPNMTAGKNHSFDYTDLCRQNDISPFQYAIQVCHSFSSKEQAPFNLR